MLRSWPVLSLRDLTSRLGLSHKQMLARFDCRVGVTPKVASRIFRFQKVLNATSSAQRLPDWSDLAIDCGYYDQAHMIHEFQEFAGLTPAAYLRSRTELPLYVALD
jgi:AraC-like DNA-binding protein